MLDGGFARISEPRQIDVLVRFCDARQMPCGFVNQRFAMRDV
jgi:hypothetical protein